MGEKINKKFKKIHVDIPEELEKAALFGWDKHKKVKKNKNSKVVGIYDWLQNK